MSIILLVQFLLDIKFVCFESIADLLDGKVCAEGY